MFYQIGKKIKTLATVVTVIGIIISVLLGIGLIAADASAYEQSSDEADLIISILIDLGISTIGCLISWLMSFLLYGYGELIDETSRLATHFCGENTSNTGSSLFGKAITIDNVTQKNNGSSFGSALSIPNKNQEENK